MLTLRLIAWHRRWSTGRIRNILMLILVRMNSSYFTFFKTSFFTPARRCSGPAQWSPTMWATSGRMAFSRWGRQSPRLEWHSLSQIPSPLLINPDKRTVGHPIVFHSDSLMRAQWAAKLINKGINLLIKELASQSSYPKPSGAGLINKTPTEQ